MIITEMCVIEVTENGLLLTEINPEFTIEEIQSQTEAKLLLAENIIDMTHHFN